MPSDPGPEIGPGRADIPFFDHAYDGYLVVAEGLDGVGKTTLLTEVAARLQARGLHVVHGRHPTTETREFPLFQRYMYQPGERPHIEYRAVLAALLSDRLQHVFAAVRPALAAGHVVLMDRYIFTMVAMMRARGYEEPWLLSACTAFPRPDAAFLLDVPLRTAIARISARPGKEDSYVEEELFLRIQEEYRWFARRGEITAVRSDLVPPGVLAEQLCEELDAVVERRAATDELRSSARAARGVLDTDSTR